MDYRNAGAAGGSQQTRGVLDYVRALRRSSELGERRQVAYHPALELHRDDGWAGGEEGEEVRAFPGNFPGALPANFPGDVAPGAHLGGGAPAGVALGALAASTIALAQG